MFSFFRRKKDDDKKEKGKNAKRDAKKEPNLTALSDSSLTVAAIDTHTLVDKDAPTNAHIFDTLARPEGQTKLDTIGNTRAKDEEHAPISCQTIPGPSAVVTEEETPKIEEPTVNFETGSSDLVFNTAPNTPVLAKHFTVTDEVVIDQQNHPGETIEFSKPDSLDSKSLETSSDSDNKEKAAVATVDTAEPAESVCETVKSEFEFRKPEMCEEMNHGPGELYDIAEEDTSVEEEDESEEEEEESEEDDDDSGNVTQHTIEEEYPDEIFKKNLANKATQDLEAQLTARETESNKLLCRIDELQRDVMVKSGGMERLQAELNAANKESEFVKKRLKKLEEDLDIVRQKNAELSDELQRKSAELKDADETIDGFDFNHLLEVEQQVKELTRRVKELESQLEQLRQERNRLEQQTQTLETEKEDERRRYQEALDKAIAEKLSIQTKYEKDFETLRTVNTDREQQLLDDFEWKLREVNQTCKKRLDEKENSCKQRIKTMEEKLKKAEEELTQLERLKQFETEATMLRGLNLEQQRALRVAERTKEELQVSEKVLQEEVKKLKEFLDKEKAALTTMQAIHNREIDEKERKMRFRLEQQKTELNNQWEEKLKKETIRLKVELDQINRDEKRAVLQSARLEKEAELQQAKEQWEQQFKELRKEVESLKQKLADNEEEYKNKMDNVRTTADCDIFELRRKLDKIDISYQDKIEKLQNEYEKEKARLTEEAERRLASCEQGLQMQLSSTRATLELVKEQLKREAAEREEALHNTHRQQLEEQWEQLVQERDEIIAVIEEKHKANLERVRAEFETTCKCHSSKEQEMSDVITKMRMDDCGNKRIICDLTSEKESLEESINELSQKCDSQKEQLHHTQEETKRLEEAHRRTSQELTAQQREVDEWRTTAQQLQGRLTQLTKELDQSADAKLIEDLRKALTDKEQQIAQLSKEKHLYQLELMNRNCHGEATAVTARQRRRGRGKPNKPGPSRGQK